MTIRPTLLFLLLFLLIGTGQRSDAQSHDKASVFAPTGEEFSVRGQADLSLDESENLSRQYSGEFGNVKVSIVSDAIRQKDGLYDRALGLAAANNAKGVSTVFRGLKAKKFVFTNERGDSCELIAVRTRKRQYVFQTSSDRKADPDSRRFFSNIRINTSRLNPPAEEKTAAFDTKYYPVYTIPSSGPGTGQGSGRGTGSGTGLGPGTGVGNGPGIGGGPGPSLGGGGQGSGTVPPQTTGSGETTTVKIISKPRPNYTDAARTNNIQGTVTLRVTFLANGTIGAISPISGLPYGLTEMAIAAARLMRFEPAKKNGVPYTSVRSIPYNFTIY